MFPSAFTLYTVLVASIALVASMPTYPKEIGSSYSGAGGQAPGGSVNSNGSALVNLFSDNAGGGGVSSSGSSRSGDNTVPEAPVEVEQAPSPVSLLEILPINGGTASSEGGLLV